MSKIIYRKIRTAPGVKQYLDDERTQVNPQFEEKAAYYAQAVATETMSMRDMAKHITSHGSPYTVDVVVGVLEAFRSCLIEQMLESKKVKVDGLGTFYVTIANKEGGEKDLSKFNIGTIAQGLRLRFLPDASQEENLSSREFLKKASFIDAATLTKDKTVEDVEDNEDDGQQSGGSSGGETPGGETPGGETPGGGDDNGGGGDPVGPDTD